MTRIFLLLTLLSNAAWSEERCFHVLLKQEGRGSFFHVTPPSLHHFNLKAPWFARKGDSVDRLRVKSSAQNAIQLFIDQPSYEAEVYTFQLYLCDDLNTYCEKKIAKVYLEKLKVRTQCSQNTLGGKT